MANELNVFLDLEETVIKSWHERSPVNLHKVQHTLKLLDAKQVTIFSFAISDDKDKETFDQENFKCALEKMFEIEIIAFPSVQEIMKVCMKHTGNHFEQHEFLSVWGKYRAFHDYCSAKHSGESSVLLDDVVHDTEFYNKTTNTRIHTIRI